MLEPSAGGVAARAIHAIGADAVMIADESALRSPLGDGESRSPITMFSMRSRQPSCSVPIEALDADRRGSRVC